MVREYGLLVTNKDLAPPDAVSVFEFWKQRLPAQTAGVFRVELRISRCEFRWAGATEKTAVKASRK